MHLDKQKPRFQIRLLEYDSDGIGIKKTKNSNVYLNSENLTMEQIWEKIKKAIETN